MSISYTLIILHVALTTRRQVVVYCVELLSLPFGSVTQPTNTPAPLLASDGRTQRYHLLHVLSQYHGMIMVG